MRFETTGIERYNNVDTLAMNLPIDNLAKLSDADFSELLGRSLLSPHLESTCTSFQRKSIVVTGAAGSIGSELCSQLLRLDVATLICIDRDETALFYLEQELSLHYAHSRIHYYVEDIGGTERIGALLREHQVDVLLHAAAYKHVPLMQRNPGAALKNNVFALTRLLEAAEGSGVKTFLLISTDKAVNPSSVMGCTKRIGELVLASRTNRDMRTLSVRFGNVLGSQGSVLPLFLQQLRNGEPLTVTHPEAGRFFMTIGEAASLLLESVSVVTSTEIVVLDVGAPIRILDMALKLRRMYGRGESEVPTVFTGLRPGEKLQEELFYDYEQRRPSGREHILIADAERFPWINLEPLLRNLEDSVVTGSQQEMHRAMAAIVPEYQFESLELLPTDKLLAPAE
jgi:FlaA1/EpsC-like NDP-sugar epimerase